MANTPKAHPIDQDQFFYAWLTISNEEATKIQQELQALFERKFADPTLGTPHDTDSSGQP